MMKDVRAGQNVLGIFYGHPGAFVSPTRRAIAIARDEGYRGLHVQRPPVRSGSSRMHDVRGNWPLD